MSRLLNVNFSRMWKNKLFWGEMLCMFALGIFFVVTVYHEGLQTGEQMYLDSSLQGYPMLIGFLCAYFWRYRVSGTESRCHDGVV